MLHLLSLVATAWSATVASDDLDDEIAAASGRAGGGTVAIGAAGLLAKDAADAVVAAHPELRAEVVSVTELDDPADAMEALLKRTGHACGLHLSASGSMFVLESFGACAAQESTSAQSVQPEATEPEATAPPPTPTAPAPSPDPQAAAPEPEPVVIPMSAPGLPPDGSARLAIGLESLALLRLDHTLADPTTATLQSLVLGFGSGHFYARDPRTAKTLLAVEGGGLLLLVLAPLLASATGEPDVGAVTLATGGAAMVASRVIGTIDVPYAVRREAEREIPTSWGAEFPRVPVAAPTAPSAPEARPPGPGVPSRDARWKTPLAITGASVGALGCGTAIGSFAASRSGTIDSPSYSALVVVNAAGWGAVATGAALAVPKLLDALGKKEDR